MNTPTTPSTVANADRNIKVSSVDRIMMSRIEKWPSNMDGHWLTHMNEARIAAAQRGLDATLIKTAASMGIARLVRKADEFQTRMFERIRGLVSAHEMPMSEVTQEMQYRITKVGSTFELTETQVNRAVVLGLARYTDDGGSPEFAVGLADFMGIAEEQRSFLRLEMEP
jgi:hypothetical protein